MKVVSHRLNDLRPGNFDKSAVDNAFKVLMDNGFVFLALFGNMDEKGFTFVSNADDYDKKRQLLLSSATVIKDYHKDAGIDVSDTLMSYLKLMCGVLGLEPETYLKLIDWHSLTSMMKEDTSKLC